MERYNGLHSDSIQIAACSQLGLLPIHFKPPTNATPNVFFYDVHQEEQKQQWIWSFGDKRYSPLLYFAKEKWYDELTFSEFPIEYKY